ncbi:hypothetical protein DWB77_02256 [Streptomyces hundungensis]|uniref:Uncharacterized protein n=1 Tax=Streptomyces hundungensis TaxID=1077946 RepID=A0A387HGV0_9ACTN|nr:hypothetical protein [Streptomyces hundungensis]AYG80130.1 hypothetical protein DWB77_02256 [Streptomyces hundungensis]
MALASLALLLTLAGYAALCAISPFARCRKCQGSGLRPSRGRSLKPCRRCRGHRYRLRTGRRLLNTGRDIHHTGTRPNPQRSEGETTPWH